MSDRELARLEVLRELTAGRLTVLAASEPICMGRRQIYRLIDAFRVRTPALADPTRDPVGQQRSTDPLPQRVRIRRS
jgi:hypothetical protein